MAYKKITRDEIIDGAFDFVKKNGFVKLNARGLASFLNCSTQPIYFQFTNMDELHQALLSKTKIHYQAYIQNSIKNEQTLFMGCMKGMINYARENKNLFSLIFEENYVKTEEEDDFNLRIIQGIMKAGGYSFESATLFFHQSWIFSYGIACGIIHGYMMFSENEINTLLQNQFEALKLYYTGK